MQFLVNIGLLNNPYANKIERTIKKMDGVRIVKSFYSVGHFEGSEPTFIGLLEFDYKGRYDKYGSHEATSDFREFMNLLCLIFNQRCIPARCADGHQQMYGDDAASYPFDNKYFLTFAHRHPFNNYSLWEGIEIKCPFAFWNAADWTAIFGEATKK
jgi:hypothetical protein